MFSRAGGRLSSGQWPEIREKRWRPRRTYTRTLVQPVGNAVVNDARNAGVGQTYVAGTGLEFHVDVVVLDEDDVVGTAGPVGALQLELVHLGLVEMQFALVAVIRDAKAKRY